MHMCTQTERAWVGHVSFMPHRLLAPELWKWFSHRISRGNDSLGCGPVGIALTWNKKQPRTLGWQVWIAPRDKGEDGKQPVKETKGTGYNSGGLEKAELEERRVWNEEDWGGDGEAEKPLWLWVNATTAPRQARLSWNTTGALSTKENNAVY